VDTLQRILIADDEIVSRTVLDDTLARWGYEVQVARDGDEAWAALHAASSPQLAILDWQMPGLDGPEICRRLRQETRDKYVYILLLTARDNRSDVIAGLASGADDYLTKPFDRHELQARLTVGRRILRLQEELIEAREALRVEATHDSLTGLWNRRGVLAMLSADLERATREGSPLALVVADLDHFKAVNDTRGHLVGDEVLRQVGRRLHDAVRPYDGVGRLGGEEFLVVLPGAPAPVAAEVAERVRRAIAGSPIAVAGGELALTLSAGVAAAPAGLVDPDPLLAAADDALYEAKRSGRDRVVVAAAIEPAPGSRRDAVPSAAAGGSAARRRRG
jgi:diguanylate cyclase (GGDEF)-like protein